VLNYDTNTISLVLCAYIILFAFTVILSVLFMAQLKLVFKQARLIYIFAKNRCCWCGCRQLASVVFIGWWLFDAGIELMCVWGKEITVSVQNLMCDGGRGVAAEGDPVEGCGLRVVWCG
jgi:hypothetical protein